MLGTKVAPAVTPCSIQLHTFHGQADSWEHWVRKPIADSFFWEIPVSCLMWLVCGRCRHWNQVKATPQNKSQNKSQGSLKRKYGAGCCRRSRLRQLCLGPTPVFYLRGLPYMMSVTFSDFFDPLLLVTVTNQLIMFLPTAFWGPPPPTHCGRHTWKPPEGDS